MGPTRPSWIKSWMRMLDAGCWIPHPGRVCWPAVWPVRPPAEQRDPAFRWGLAWSARCCAVGTTGAVPGDLLADAWLLGRLGSSTPPSPSSFAPTPSLACVCTVLGGGTLGQSLLPDDAIRGHAKLAGTLVPATALTHRTGRESEQPLSTPVTAAAADWWMGGRHREWPRGLWMVDGPAACLSAPMVPPRAAMEPCLVFLRPTAHGSGWLLPIDKYQRHPAHIVMSLPLHHHPPPLDEPDFFSTLLDNDTTFSHSSSFLRPSHPHPSPFTINTHVDSMIFPVLSR